MSDLKSKQLLLKMSPEQLNNLNQLYNQYVSGSGNFTISQSELIRQKLYDFYLSGKIKDFTPANLYKDSLSFITEFVEFLALIKNFWIRQNGGTAEVNNKNDELILKYFLSVISRVDDARLLGGNVYSFQTLFAIERALFESAVDITLLNRGPLDIFEKIRAYDRLSVIQNAKNINNYVSKFNIDLNDNRFSPLKIHIDNISDVRAIDKEVNILNKTIDKKNSKYWKPTNLEFNAEHADLFREYKFYEWYNIRYKISCMNTHGSGVAGLGTTDPQCFMGNCFFSYLNIIKWATIAYYESFSFLKKIDKIHIIKLSNIIEKHLLSKFYPELKEILK